MELRALLNSEKQMVDHVVGRAQKFLLEGLTLTPCVAFVDGKGQLVIAGMDYTDIDSKRKQFEALTKKVREMGGVFSITVIETWTPVGASRAEILQADQFTMKGNPFRQENLTVVVRNKVALYLGIAEIIKVSEKRRTLKEIIWEEASLTGALTKLPSIGNN